MVSACLPDILCFHRHFHTRTAAQLLPQMGKSFCNSSSQQSSWWVKQPMTHFHGFSRRCWRQRWGIDRFPNRKKSRRTVTLFGWPVMSHLNLADAFLCLNSDYLLKTNQKFMVKPRCFGFPEVSTVLRSMNSPPHWVYLSLYTGPDWEKRQERAYIPSDPVLWKQL